MHLTMGVYPTQKSIPTRTQSCLGNIANLLDAIDELLLISVNINLLHTQESISL